MDLNGMRQELAERELEILSEGDILNILLDGCAGWNNIHPDEVEYEYRRVVLGEDVD